ncbi:hypothetical protein Ahy_B06g084063 isoform A [Arachis hypogaea]|uniref:Prephenate/arogenate dehydrogenase domain-containing protein n=1 Tax=Arachis hypogaea TaxID=3818 RepID=A0A444YQX2_ARAHY|nr:hypothetical protein Ahy_B06g084063 isoform A [Arachis hypogaea]
MVDMSGEDHNRYAAGLQFITYTVGRILEGLMLESMPINMKGYQSLLGLVENTVEDSFDLYYGLFMFNKNSLEVLEKFDLAFGDLKKQLIARMHHVVRNQLMENGKRSNDVALLSGFTSNNSSPSDDNTKLKIAIVGFGNFGQFLAKTIVSQAHGVLAYSRSDYSNVAGSWGFMIFLSSIYPKVILLCTSILSTVKVLKSLPFQRLKRSTLFADVLSVKEFPRNLFLQHLLPDFDVLCTHPMFGLQSGKNGCKKLPLVYEKVRIRNEESRILRCYGFLDIFASEGLQMVEMSCAKHDWHVAGSQFVTHTTGRFLEKLGLETTPINTKGYETLLSLAENIEGDSFDLRLHSIYQTQLFKNEEQVFALPERSMLPKKSEEQILLELLLFDFDVLYTHSMFGLESAFEGWTDLPFVFEKVRIIDEEHCVSYCAKFLNAFAKEGCRMVEMSCEDQDYYAAGSTATETTMLSIATLNPSTSFNHSPDYTVHRILNCHSLLPSTFSLPSNSNPYCSSSTYRPLCVCTIDAAQLFDYKSKLGKEFTISKRLKIAIVDFGNFGLAATLVRQGHTVLAHSCSDHSATAIKLGTGLPFIFKKVYILDKAYCVSHCERFLSAFAIQGCRMVEISCEDHDSYVACLQFIAHTVGRILEGLMLESTLITMLSIATLNPSTPFNRSPDYTVCCILNGHSLFPSIFSVPSKSNPYCSSSTYRHLCVHAIYSARGTPSSPIQSFLLCSSTYSQPSGCSSCYVSSATQLFDYVSKLATEFTISKILKITIVGFGNFAQFLETILVCHEYTVLAHNRSDHSATARMLGVSFFQNLDDLSKEHPERVLIALPFQRLKCSTLFIHVLSVKEFRKKLLFELLPNQSLYGLHYPPYPQPSLSPPIHILTTVQIESLLIFLHLRTTPRVHYLPVPQDCNCRLWQLQPVPCRHISLPRPYLLAHSQSDHSVAAKKLGVSFFQNRDEFWEELSESACSSCSFFSSSSATVSLLMSSPSKNFPRSSFLSSSPPILTSSALI